MAHMELINHSVGIAGILSSHIHSEDGSVKDPTIELSASCYLTMIIIQLWKAGKQLDLVIVERKLL